MEKIEEETGIIVSLPHEYDHIMAKGVSRFDNEQTKFAKSAIMTQINKDAIDPILKN